jgi:hypothetical protein
MSWRGVRAVLTRRQPVVIELFSCHFRSACSFSEEMMARLPRAALFALALSAARVLNTTASAQAPPGSLWYNGDFDGVGYHDNGHNTSGPADQVHDDFNVIGHV